VRVASVTREEPVQPWIIDDTGYPKTGSLSVGVTRQYCGQVGNQKNCQIAVSLAAATHQGSLPVAYRLNLPKDWAEDPVRRTNAGVPDDVTFQAKPEIALQSPTRATMLSSTTLSSSRGNVRRAHPFGGSEQASAVNLVSPAQSKMRRRAEARERMGISTDSNPSSTSC
jgi:hypothetical protein